LCRKYIVDFPFQAINNITKQNITFSNYKQLKQNDFLLYDQTNNETTLFTRNGYSIKDDNNKCWNELELFQYINKNQNNLTILSFFKN
jgi:hypothetical protein